VRPPTVPLGTSRLRITVSAAHTDADIDRLRGALAESGWSVDEVVYATRFGGAHEAVARSVVEHVASLDSLNRLI
jgi:hypothetical protein